MEDNPINQRVAVILANKLGFIADVAGDGSEALNMVRDQDYTLILMDCQMPVMDGFEATRAIRALETPVAQVPIIAVTANVMEGQRDKCLAAGMNDYLPKPINKDVLRKTVDKWIPQPTDPQTSRRRLLPPDAGCSRLRTNLPSRHVFDVSAAVLTQEDTLHWLALRMVPGLGTLGTLRLLEKLKSPHAIFRASASELEAAGLSPSQARNVASGCSFEDAVDQQQKLLNAGAQLISIHDPRYPQRFAADLRSAFAPVCTRPNRADVLAFHRCGRDQASHAVRNRRHGAAQRRLGEGGPHDCQRDGTRHRYGRA